MSVMDRAVTAKQQTAVTNHRPLSTVISAGVVWCMAFMLLCNKTLDWILPVLFGSK
jgi:hypothetical protein